MEHTVCAHDKGMRVYLARQLTKSVIESRETYLTSLSANTNRVDWKGSKALLCFGPHTKY